MIVNIKDDEFNRLTNYIKLNYGINLSKKKHLIEGRLNNTLILKGFSDYSSYMNFVFSNPTEITELINSLTTNHTYFMREPEHFKFFKDELLPYFEKTIKDKDLRIWSAASSTGEEAYTLAMIIADYFGDKKNLWDTKILATDISQKVLSVGKRGVYSAESVEKLPQSWKEKYFKKIDSNFYEVHPKIKNEVIFAQYNLMNETLPFRKKFHIIFCRNVMIYFEKDTKTNLVERFYNHTVDSGYLLIGLSENLDNAKTKYNFVKPSIFRKGLIP